MPKRNVKFALISKIANLVKAFLLFEAPILNPTTTLVRSGTRSQKHQKK